MKRRLSKRFRTAHNLKPLNDDVKECNGSEHSNSGKEYANSGKEHANLEQPQSNPEFTETDSVSDIEIKKIPAERVDTLPRIDTEMSQKEEHHKTYERKNKSLKKY